jgi:Gamma-glutamyltransferase
MATGVMGAFMQTQGHLQMLVRCCLYGQDVQTAIDAPRWRFMENMRVEVEESFPQEHVDALRSAAHEVDVVPWKDGLGFGGAQLIQTLPHGDGYVAGSDPRKDGCALTIG